MNNHVLNITRDELMAQAKAVGLTPVPCRHNPHRVTLLGYGERAETYTEGNETTIVWHTGKKIGVEITHPMPIIVEKLLNLIERFQ